MMRSYVLSVALACIAASAAAAGSPHNGSINSSAAEVLALGQKAVRTWLQGNTVGCGWEDGTFMIGLATLERATGDATLRDAMVAYGEQWRWDMCLQLGGGAANPDNQVCAATYLELHLTSNSDAKNSTWLAATAAHLDGEVADARSTQRWSWVDALFMAMAVWARLGAATGNQAYFDKMHTNFVHAALTPHPGGFGFWSAEDRLFYRDPPKGAPSGVFWSRGNGWAAAALVQAMQFSPPGDPHMQTYTSVFKQQMARLLALQGADGCWRSSLTDTAFYPLPETTGTALFTYAMGYGVRAGLLDRGAYTPAISRAWQCLTTVSLHADGALGNCQPVGWRPAPNWNENSTSSFCVGHFALAATAVAQLLL